MVAGDDVDDCPTKLEKISKDDCPDKDKDLPKCDKAGLKKDDLKEECRRRRLNVSGNKADLVCSRTCRFFLRGYFTIFIRYRAISDFSLFSVVNE